MIGLIGYATTSASLLAALLHRSKVVVYCPFELPCSQKAITQVKEAEVVLLSSIAYYKALKEHISGVAVILDSPINLCAINGIVLGDCVNNPISSGISYKFVFKPPSIAPILSALKKKKKIADAVIQQPLTCLVENRTNGVFMSHVNNLIYNSTCHTNRLELGNLIYALATGAQTPAKFRSRVKAIIDMNFVRDALVDAVVQVVQSDYGTRLKASLADIKQQKLDKKPISYASLEKKHEVNKDDIKGVVAFGQVSTED